MTMVEQTSQYGEALGHVLVSGIPTLPTLDNLKPIKPARSVKACSLQEREAPWARKNSSKISSACGPDSGGELSVMARPVPW
jgi:hypothetical protein